ncbi:MAG: class I SAM-dependent methyltransferase [Pseudomonadota bacterium]
MLQCCICQQSVDRWLPHPQIAQRSEFMKLMRAVGSDLSVYQCPRCGCNDRDRHLRLYMEAVGLPAQMTGARVLHLAPEAHLERWIQQLQPARYVRGDLHPTRPGHVKLDAEQLPFDDGSFDLIICNHVLEHVSSPERALAEFRRCLGPKSLLIAQTPFAPLLKKTFELDETPTPDFAKLFYGQEDHVRLFGADIVDYFRGAGFQGSLLAHEAVLPKVDAQASGCNALEPFFLFYTPGQPQ